MNAENPALPIKTNNGVDITTSVQILYDFMHSSLEWGSGMFDNEEVEHLIRFAIQCGFEVPPLGDNAPALMSVALKFPEHYHVDTSQKMVYRPAGQTEMVEVDVVKITVIKKKED